MKKLAGIVLCGLLANSAIADTFIIRGAEIHTVGPRGTLQNSDIVVEDGIIREVGRNADAPPGATSIDATGKIVTPGFFSPMGQIGVTEINAVLATVDFVQRGDQFAAGFEIADAFNPRSTLIAVNRIEGVTRAAITPAARAPDEFGHVSDVFSGIGALVRLGDASQALLKRRAMLVANIGARGGQLAGGSRAAALQRLRAALEDAADYATNKDAYERGERRDYSVSRADLEALQEVLAGRLPLLVTAERASDIRALLRLAREFELRLVIAGGAEAWLLADDIATAGAGVILNATGNLPDTFDELNARLDSAALLAEAGVAISFGGDRQVINHNARNIAQAAGVAVANGLTWEAALRAITLAPAEFYGVADVTGSIEPGKEADLVIWPADPLELTSFPEKVFIRGEEIEMKSRQTLLRDRYLQTGSELPPAFRH